jgi:hypothetical protein
MRYQLWLKFYINWKEPGRENHPIEVSKCDFCGEWLPCGSLTEEHDNTMMADICKKCSDNLPSPHYKSLTDFRIKLREKYIKEGWLK